jgi:hypothetical protein
MSASRARHMAVHVAHRILRGTRPCDRSVTGQRHQPTSARVHRRPRGRGRPGRRRRRHESFRYIHVSIWWEWKQAGRRARGTHQSLQLGYPLIRSARRRAWCGEKNSRAAAAVSCARGARGGCSWRRRAYVGSVRRSGARLASKEGPSRKHCHKTSCADGVRGLLRLRRPQPQNASQEDKIMQVRLQ